MSMFPGASAIVYRNEAGEPIGWDTPSDDPPDPDDFYENDWFDDEDEDDDEGSDGDHPIGQETSAGGML